MLSRPATPFMRLRLTWSEKVGIIAKVVVSPALSYTDIANWAVSEYSLLVAPSKAAICSTMKAKAVLSGRPVEKVNASLNSHLILDQNVVDFVMLSEAIGASLSGAMIVEHAKNLVRKLDIPTELPPPGL
ncbi:hypothetical protein PRNP1_013321 [Phytophthora ramorum]